MEESPPGSIWRSKLVAPTLAILCIYVVMRLITNYQSWSPTGEILTDQDTKAHEAGDAYDQMIANNAARDAQIQTLWKLIQLDQWHLPRGTEIGDAPDLAKDLQTKAIANYQGGNMPQAASYAKILLRWSTLVFNSTGGNNGGMQLELGNILAKTALDTLQKCPAILQYIEIKKLLEQLRAAIEDEAETHFKRELGAYLQNVPAGDLKKNGKALTFGEKLFSSQRRLNDLIQDYLKGQFATGKPSSHLWAVKLKAYLQCPLTMRLFAKSVKPLEEQSGISAALLTQIRDLQQMKQPAP